MTAKCGLSLSLLYEPVPGFILLFKCVCVCARVLSHAYGLPHTCTVPPCRCRTIPRRPPVQDRLLSTTLPPSHTHSRTRGHQCERPIHLFLQHFLHLFWFVHSPACVHTCLWHIPFLSPASIRCHLHSSHHHPHFPSFTPLRKSWTRQ